jgi:phosphoglycolate phosphatase-like HAD superfamily hydrolase
MKLAVFDFDGVIVDSKNLWVSAVHRETKKRGYKFHKKYISERMGHKLKITLGRLGVKPNRSMIDGIHDDVTKNIRTIHLCRDIKQVEKIKRKAKTAILTNSPRYFIEKALGSRKKYFDRILCSEDFDTKENAIAMLMKKFNAGKKETVYVGDMRIDRGIAKKAGCRSIIVLAHSWDKEFWEKRKYKFVIGSLKELENAAGI